jgi:tetratricopeptide (TPR) repeat protein
MRPGQAHPSLADYHQALDLMGQGRFQDAALTLRHCLGMDPDFFDARFLLARVLRRAGCCAEAWEEIHTCLRSLPDDAGVLEEAAELALLAGEKGHAMQVLERLLAKRPSDNIVRQRLVTVTFMRDGAKKAIRTAIRLLREHPKWAGGYRTLGHLYELEGQVSLAEDAYSKAIAIDPNESQILEDLRRLWRGFTLEENPLRLDMAGLFMAEAKRLVSEGVSSQALAWLEKWDVRFKEQAALIEAFAEGCCQLGEYERAVAAIDSVSRDAHSTSMHQLKARALVALGRGAEASDWIQASASEIPHSAQTWREIIHSLIQAGENSQAAEAADQAVKQVPDDAELWYLRAFLARESGCPEKTILSLEKAVSLAPRYREALFALGVERLKAGKADEAVPPLGDLRILDPENVEAWRHLAIAHTNCHSWEEALEAWKRVLDLSPKDPQAAGNIPQIDRLLGSSQSESATRRVTKI